MVSLKWHPYKRERDLPLAVVFHRKSIGLQVAASCTLRDDDRRPSLPEFAPTKCQSSACINMTFIRRMHFNHIRQPLQLAACLTMQSGHQCNCHNIPLVWPEQPKLALDDENARIAHVPCMQDAWRYDIMYTVQHLGLLTKGPQRPLQLHMATWEKSKCLGTLG